MRRRTTALSIVLGLVAALTMMISSVAVAQTTTLTHLMFVNGGGVDPVDVTVNGELAAAQVAFAEASNPDQPAVVQAGQLDIAYNGTTVLAVDAPADTAWTIVDGFGEDPNTATAYQVPIEAIPEGNAVVAVWNGSAQAVDITVNGTVSAGVAPGQEVGTSQVAAGDTVTIEADGQSLSVTPDADNYISVFVVNNGTATGIAAATIPAMQRLVDGITPPPTPTVPDVTGQTATDATQTLVNAGYNVAESQEASDDVEAGLVIRSEPTGGTELALGETVTIFVSTGPGNVVVPDVTGTPVDDATNELEGVGLASSTVEEASDDVEEGLVISQNPSAGTEVAPGTEVVLTVSTGPGDVEVPDFVGLTVEEANALAEDSGLEPVFVEDPDDPDPDGIVVEQDPEAGTVVPFGSEVTLQLSPAIEDAWTSIKIDPDRLLTAAGLNFLPESTSEITVLGTDMIGRDVVDDSGFWIIEMDISSLDPLETYELLVTGTAEDGSDYEQTFTIPPAGEEPDELEPVEDEGISPWVWIIGILVLVALIALVILLVQQMRSESGGDGGDAPPEPEATE